MASDNQAAQLWSCQLLRPTACAMAYHVVPPTCSIRKHPDWRITAIYLYMGAPLCAWSCEAWVISLLFPPSLLLKQGRSTRTWIKVSNPPSALPTCQYFSWRASGTTCFYLYGKPHHCRLTAFYPIIKTAQSSRS